MFVNLLTVLLSSVAVIAADISITVGANGLQYSPNTVTAAVGDSLNFKFSGEHTVTQSSFNTPCTPSGGFDSETMSTGTFTVKVNDTNPIWVFCEVPGHCKAGMVFAVNPPTSGNNTFANFQAIAEGKSLPSSSTTTTASASGSSTPSGSATSSSASSTSTTTTGAADHRFTLSGGPLFLSAFAITVAASILG